MRDREGIDDLPDGAGCTEIAEHMASRRQDEPVEPQEDLAHSFFALDDAPSAPYDAVTTDPVLREIGDTPIVLHPENEQIVCKLERENPTLSHKDRLGAGMIVGLRQMGELDPEQRVVEASSGNTAGAVALAANRLGHPCTIVLRESASPVKMSFVKALGAELVTTPSVGPDHDEYYQTVAERYAREHDAVYLNQYERELNRYVHAEWTAPELHRQICDQGVTHLVGAMSTGGLVSGLGEYFTEADPSIRIVGVDAVESTLWRAFDGETYDPGDYETDVEGLGQWRVTETTNFDVIDDVRTVSDSIAISRAKHEATDNGLLMGPSSGAAMEIAQDISHDNDDARVVSIVHDGVEQYGHHVDGW